MAELVSGRRIAMHRAITGGDAITGVGNQDSGAIGMGGGRNWRVHCFDDAYGVEFGDQPPPCAMAWRTLTRVHGIVFPAFPLDGIRVLRRSAGIWVPAIVVAATGL